MSLPTVSVIMPTYNRLEFLRQAVECVLAQTYTDWELIIADDESGEPTRSYLRSLTSDPRITVLELPHSGQCAKGRNAAFLSARGEFLAYLDSDDIWLPEKLTLQMQSMHNRSARGWSYTRFAVVNADLVPIPGKGPERWPSPDGWIFPQLLSLGATIAVSSVVIHRRLLEAVGGYDESKPVCEDYDLWLKLALRSEVDVVDAPLMLKREHTQHYAKDVDCYEELRDSVRRIGARPEVAAHRHVVARALARLAAGHADSYALLGEYRAALGIIRQSFSSSWRHGIWWLGVARTLRHLFARLSQA